MSLTRNDGKNIASLNRIWVMLKSQVQDTHHLPDSDIITENITHTGLWTPLEIVKGEASWQEVQTEDAHGPVWDYTIQLQLHKDRQAVTSALKAFVHKDLVVLAEDRNDLVKRLIGEVGLFSHHARLTYTQSKELKGGRNTYDVIITARMARPAAYYEGAVNE